MQRNFEPTRSARAAHIRRTAGSFQAIEAPSKAGKSADGTGSRVAWIAQTRPCWDRPRYKHIKTVIVPYTQGRGPCLKCGTKRGRNALKTLGHGTKNAAERRAAVETLSHGTYRSTEGCRDARTLPLFARQPPTGSSRLALAPSPAPDLSEARGDLRPYWRGERPMTRLKAVLKALSDS